MLHKKIVLSLLKFALNIYCFGSGIIEISPLQSVWGHFAIWQEPKLYFFGDLSGSNKNKDCGFRYGRCSFDC